MEYIKIRGSNDLKEVMIFSRLYGKAFAWVEEFNEYSIYKRIGKTNEYKSMIIENNVHTVARIKLVIELLEDLKDHLLVEETLKL